MNAAGRLLGELALVRLADLPRLHAFVEQVCARAGVDEASHFALRLAAEEAFINKLQHGYDGEGPVRFRAFADGTSLRLEMYDQAPAFDPAHGPVPDIEADWQERDAGGLGLYLLRQMMDEVRYEVGLEDGNRLTLVKHIPENTDGRNDTHEH